MAWNGTSLGVFSGVSRNFAKSGGTANTHQGDLFVALDAHGKLIDERTELWSASHSSLPRLALGPAGEMLTLTVGDAYPFGIYYINRDSKKTSVIWPEEHQRTPAIRKAVRTTTGAGTMCGFLRSGNKLFATIDASRTLPNPNRQTSGDVMLVRFDLDGVVEKKTWITNTSGKRERCPNIVPHRQGFLLAWTEIVERDDERAVLAVVDADGEVVHAPAEVTGAQRHNYHSDVIALPCGGAAWVTAGYRAGSIDIYKVAP